MLKYRFQHPRRRKHPLSPRDLFRLPEKEFYRLPELEIRGGVVLTEGCRKILDFDTRRVCLDMGNFIVTFYGQTLRIESLNGKRAVVAGRITRIDFAAKWARWEEKDGR